MIKKVLVLLMVSTAWAAPLRPEVPEVKKFHEAMAEVKTTETIDTDATGKQSLRSRRPEDRRSSPRS